MRKPRILIIGHGGTIAMARNAAGFLEPAKSIEDLFRLAPLIMENVDADLLNLENEDSVNLHPGNWLKLAKILAEKRGDYDAFVITHGTDSMSYSASAVGLLLDGNFDKPIVFTGSQMPMAEWGNDGTPNFERAVRGAVDAYYNGVCETMVFFDKWLMRATRTVKRNESELDAFVSPVVEPIALFKGTGFQFKQHARKLVDDKGLPIIEGVVLPEALDKVHFNANILPIGAFPGLNPKGVQKIIELPEFEGFVLYALGAGNVSTKAPFSLIEPIKLAHELKKPFVVATQFLGGNVEENYETGAAAIRAGGISAGDMTTPTTVVKLARALGEGVPYDEMAEYLHTDFCGEISPADSKLNRFDAEHPHPRITLPSWPALPDYKRIAARNRELARRR